MLAFVTQNEVLGAIDLTIPRAPRLLWTAAAPALHVAGDLSPPAIARIRTGGTQRDPRHFIVVTGGAASRASTAGAPAAGALATGAHLLMLDATSGRELWRGGTGATFAPGPMQFPFSAPLTALDVDADGFTDRLYGADAGGQLWRFDVWPGESAGGLLAASVLATLLDGAEVAGGLTFTAAADVALMHSSTGPYLNIALGTSQRRDVAVERNGWFFSIRDREPFERWSAARHAASVPLTAADITQDRDHSPSAHMNGWRLQLPRGAQLRAASLTAAGTLLFTAFTSVTRREGCESGVNVLYALAVDDAAATLDLDANGNVEARDATLVLRSTTPLPTPRVRPQQGETPPSGVAAASLAATCMVADEALPACVRMPGARRTFWLRTDAQ